MIYYGIFESSVGIILIGKTDKGVCAIKIGKDKDELVTDLKEQFFTEKVVCKQEATEKIAVQISEYLQGNMKGFHLFLDTYGTNFQKQVWEGLQNIPFGKTLSYQKLAEKIGQPESVRAVANACGKNKIAVIIPCHRVLRKNGDLGGYRWGVGTKQKLLEIENKFYR